MTKAELAQCIQAYGTDIYSFCTYLTGSKQEAEDLYQDTFLKAVEMHDKIKAGQNPKSYLLAVAVRIWKNKRRKFAWRKRIADMQAFTEGQEAESSGGVEQSAEAQYLRREEAQAVRAAVATLPQRYRMAVLLFYMESLSVAQIASVMQIPEGTVKSRLYHARRILEKELEVVLNEKRS
ncbi:MAG: RNA polymerase sigma factor [Eubacterium sp.]|nr:RNA polymerase sigma factor [Eubacterium sp.]